MNSRMEKYDEGKSNNVSRAERNKKLYDSVTDIDMDYIDIDVDNVLEIETNDLTKKGVSRSDYQKVKELGSIVPNATEVILDEEAPIREEKIYDINEILERARTERKEVAKEEKKRLINTEYNILTKLDIDDIDKRDLNEAEIKEIIRQTYPEKEIEDDGKELFYDMVEEKQIEKELTEEVLNKNVEDVYEEQEENTENTEEVIVLEAKEESEEEKEVSNDKIIEEEKEKQEEDFYTTTSTTQILKEQKKSKKVLVFVIITVLILLAMGVYLFLKYFGTL